MTSESPKVVPNEKPSSTKRKKMSQERVMILFTLVFVLGILLLVLTPEGHAARGIVMTVYTIAVFWGFFRFCI